MSKLITNIKTVYSLRIRNILMIYGFNYLKEIDHPKIPGFKCWLYEATPDFLKFYDEILIEDQKNKGGTKDGRNWYC